MYLRNRVKAFDNFNEYGTETNEIDVKKCIKYVARTWDNVTNVTIKNCWLKAGIMPEYGEPSDDESVDRDDQENHADIQLELERLKELEEVQILIDKLDFEEPFTAEEFIEYDEFEPTNEKISDEEILNGILPNEKEKKEDENPLPTITHNEVIECYDKVILYLQHQEKIYHSNSEDIKFIKKLKKEALKERFGSTRQINLDNFVNVFE